MKLTLQGTWLIAFHALITRLRCLGSCLYFPSECSPWSMVLWQSCKWGKILSWCQTRLTVEACMVYVQYCRFVIDLPLLSIKSVVARLHDIRPYLFVCPVYAYAQIFTAYFGRVTMIKTMTCCLLINTSLIRSWKSIFIHPFTINIDSRGFSIFIHHFQRKEYNHAEHPHSVNPLQYFFLIFLCLLHHGDLIRINHIKKPKFNNSHFDGSTDTLLLNHCQQGLSWPNLLHSEEAHEPECMMGLFFSQWSTSVNSTFSVFSRSTFNFNSRRSNGSKLLHVPVICYYVMAKVSPFLRIPIVNMEIIWMKGLISAGE